MEIRALSPKLVPDYLDYFDNRAFPDNPGWASCYCHFFHAETTVKPWGEYTAEENRAAVVYLINNGQFSGYLAYEGRRAVGWCHAAPRRLIPALQHLPGDKVNQVGSIVCFVIAKSFRHHGVASQLLVAACEGFRQQGLTIAEAYPRPRSRIEAANHYGPMRMFLNAGFSIYHREKGKRPMLRKDLENSD